MTNMGLREHQNAGTASRLFPQSHSPTVPHFNRAGFALPLVIAVLALGGMLVTASFLLGRLESQSGENGLRSARAFEMAETGLASTLAHWDPLFDTLPIGGRA